MKIDLSMNILVSEPFPLKFKSEYVFIKYIHNHDKKRIVDLILYQCKVLTRYLLASNVFPGVQFLSQACV